MNANVGNAAYFIAPLSSVEPLSASAVNAEPRHKDLGREAKCGSYCEVALVTESERILDYLDAPPREDKYFRARLDHTWVGDLTTDQLQHVLACRRQMELHKNEESVFDELCRLRMQADENTEEWFDRITKRGYDRVAQQLADEATVNVSKETLRNIALGMLEDGWPEHKVRYALTTRVGR